LSAKLVSRLNVQYAMSCTFCMFFVCLLILVLYPAVLWHCCLADGKGIRLVNSACCKGP